jgi:glycosyltransferase involved in cell wall biosynthesis
MKLCFVTHKVIVGDGQGRVNYEVTKEAIRRGHQVTLVAGQVSSDLQESSQVTWIPITADGVPTDLGKGMIFSWKSSTWLRKHQSEFDVITVNGALTTIDADVNAAHFVHTRWLQSSSHISRHRHDLYGLYQWLYSFLNSQWEKEAFYRSNIIIAVSTQVKKELISLGISEQKIIVISNGVDLEEFFPGEVDRSKWHLPEQVPLGLFVGDIRSNRKNLDTILKAMVQVPKLHLLVVGALEGSSYPKLAVDLGIANRVSFLDYKDNVSEIMRLADLFIFPSRYEACSLVILEAMASGLPVITASTTGGSELITPESGLILNDPENFYDLAEKIIQLIQESITLKKMGQAARKVAEEHSWRSKASAYLNLFEEIATEKVNRCTQVSQV